MEKYIITWMLISWVNVPCSQSGIDIDEFGRTTNNNIQTCTAIHMKKVEQEKSKLFFNRDSAFAFFNRLKLASEKQEEYSNNHYEEEIGFYKMEIKN